MKGKIQFYSLCFLVIITSKSFGKTQVFLQPSVSDTNTIIAIKYPPLTEREGKGLQPPTPPKMHPRLFLMSKDVVNLKEKTQNPLLKSCWERIEAAANFKTEGYLPLNGSKYNNNKVVRDAIEAKALFFVLYNDGKGGRAAIDNVLHYFATLKIDSTAADVTREIGRAIVTGAIVYDWCYALLSVEEKTILIGRMETLATHMEIKWPAIHGSSITGHTVEAQLSRDMLALAIAVYDENPNIYERVVGRIFAEFVPARQFYYPGDYHHQGSAYGAYRFNWEMFATFIFDKMGYPNLYGKQQAKVPYYFIYRRRPDGQLLRDGDDYTEQSTPFGQWWSLGQSANFLAGSYHKDPIVLNEAFKERQLGNTSDYIFDFLFFNPIAVGTKTKNDLPLTHYFQAPLGEMIARTSWEDGLQSTAVVASMKVGVYNFSNHQHLDAGSFQLYYKGPLTVQSGIYQGKNGSYGGEHFKNYYQRTIAHNTMLVYDPNEKFTWHHNSILNDGGQRFPNDAHEPENLTELLGKGYKTGEVLAHSFGPDSLQPDFSYLKGDITEAYSNKVKNFHRSFVFLNFKNTSIPAALVVFDNISTTDQSFKKCWLLHCVEEPTINENQISIERTEKGYSGKMLTTCLLPNKNDLLISSIGGAGKEYEVFGKNFPQTMNNQMISSGDSAVWRTEISPKKPALKNQFLNVMQVMDNNTNIPATNLPLKIESAEFIGTKISNQIVLFSKDGNIINQTFQLTLTGDEELKVLITDVKKGNWQIQSKGLKLVVKNDEQVLYFTAKKGNYTFTKKQD